MSPETDGSVLDDEPNSFFMPEKQGKILSNLVKLKNSGF